MFPLCVRDMRLSYITPSTFFQVFACCNHQCNQSNLYRRFFTGASHLEFINFNKQQYYKLSSYCSNANDSSSMLRQECLIVVSSLLCVFVLAFIMFLICKFRSYTDL